MSTEPLYVMDDVRFYLAGPMSGLPEFNFPAFREAAAEMRSWGVQIVSPAELDGAEVEAEAAKSHTGEFPSDGKLAGKTWGDMLSRDLKIVIDDVVGIVLLPGWEESRGANLECYAGLLTGKLFYTYDPVLRKTTNRSPDYIRGRML